MSAPAAEVNVSSWTRVEGTLMAAARAVRRAYDKRLREMNVHLGEASVLAHLNDAGMLSQVELANRIVTGKANAGLLIDSLQAKGLVHRQADPNDRRVWRVVLTEDGRDTWRRIAQIDSQIRRQLRDGTTAHERDLLEALLKRIHASADSILNDDTRS